MQNAVEPDSTIPYLPLKGAITIQLASKPRKDNSCHLNCQRVLNRNSKNGFPFTSSNRFYNKCYRNISNIRHTWIALPIDLPAGICFIGVMVMTSAAIQLSAFELDDDAERFLPELSASAMATRLRSTVHRYF